jgi:hypothetical protein
MKPILFQRYAVSTVSAWITMNVVKALYAPKAIVKMKMRLSDPLRFSR